MPLLRAEVLRKQQLLYPNLKHDPNQVLYLPFDKDDGSFARDRSGYNNHGTIYGASRVAGKVGGAPNFDGVDDYVDIPHHSSLSVADGLANGFTILAWIKTVQPDGIYRGVVSKGYASPYGEWALAINYGRIAGSFGGIGWRELTAPKVNDGEWHLIGYCSDFATNTGMIILDGEFKASFTGVTKPGSNSLSVRLGRQTTWYAGVIDEVRIFSRALSVDEIRRLMHMRGL